MHLNIADGPVLFFDDNGFNAYFGWEQVEALRQTVQQTAHQTEKQRPQDTSAG